ncbi:hypothetical protein AOG2_31780 [Geobacter sp. AOG2]|nr:hypothetical protein AOG2_31780 [Geobacter sp. AOG2]
MPLLSWRAEYSVNEAELDRHHEEMFNILNSVYDDVMNSPALGFILPNIDKLTTIAECHLSAEEQYLEKMHFPDIADHIAKHREFTQTIERIRSGYNDNDLEASKQLIIVLGEWLIHHVLKEDRKYSHLKGSRGTA